MLRLLLLRLQGAGGSFGGCIQVPAQTLHGADAHAKILLDTPVPGWQLPASWAADDEEFDGEGGPRRFGRLRCRYTSDPKYDCEPNIPVRRGLRERFLCGTVTQM